MRDPYICTTCGEDFGAERTFDLHRRGAFAQGAVGASPERKCLTPEQMKAKGMVQNKSGIWGREANNRTFPPRNPTVEEDAS